jgi:hypothetical protein
VQHRYLANEKSNKKDGKEAKSEDKKEASNYPPARYIVDLREKGLLGSGLMDFSKIESPKPEPKPEPKKDKDGKLKKVPYVKLRKQLETAEDLNGLGKIVYKDPEETKKKVEGLHKKMDSLVEEQKKAGERWGKQFNEESYKFEREWSKIVDAVKNE